MPIVPVLTPHPRTFQIKRNDGDPNVLAVLRYCTGGFYVNEQHLVIGEDIVFKEIPESTTQPIIYPRSSILHTNAGTGSAKSLWSWITQSSVTGEPHFQVPMNEWDKVEQYMPLNRRADCNYSANSFTAYDALYNKSRVFGAISFETQDKGAATLNDTPWTLAQIRRMTGIITAMSIIYDLACIEPAKWDRSGIGHHTLFPFQGIGYPAWTNVRGKTCPGTRRISQMDYIRAKVAENLAGFMQHTDWKCRASAD